MRVVITGGAGFIGSNIAHKLVKQGYEVSVLDDLSTGCTSNLNGLELDLIEGSILDRKILDQVLSNCDVVIHAAASVGNVRSLENPAADANTNYLGTINVLESMRVNGVTKIIYSSSSSGYGEPKYVPIDEAHTLQPASPYGVSKIAAEMVVLTYGYNYSFSAICLRYFNAFGRYQRVDHYGGVMPLFCHQILNGQPVIVYGDGEQTRDFIHVDDITSANLCALKTENSGFYNVGSGEPTTINQLVNLLRKISGKDFPVDYLPARKGEVKHVSASIAKIKEKLGFEPACSLESGLERYFGWYESEFG